jgi:hypothetical protein
MNKTMIVMPGVIASFLLLASFSSQAASIPDWASEAVPLGSYVDCQDSCRNCQGSCQQNVPAGSKQSDCIRGCTGTASSCCQKYGKNPPSYTGCTCQ